MNLAQPNKSYVDNIWFISMRQIHRKTNLYEIKFRCNVLKGAQWSKQNFNLCKTNVFLWKKVVNIYYIGFALIL